MPAWNLISVPDSSVEKAGPINRRAFRRHAARWLAAFALLALSLPAEAKTFSCAGGDTACLIDAIVAANANGTANTIKLLAGVYTLTAPYSAGAGAEPTGLPLVTAKLTITGEGAENTVIERSAVSQPFRLFNATGDLSLRAVTLRGGGGRNSSNSVVIVRGGCILSSGSLAIADSVITNCQARDGAGFNANQATVLNSTISGNSGAAEGGGILGVNLVITNTTIVENSALFGGGIDVTGSGGTLTIVNSTLARNGAAAGSAIHLGPASDAPRSSIPYAITATIENSTIVDNASNAVPFSGRALHTDQGPTLTIKGSILARNAPAATADCPNGGATSLGFNLVGNPASCPTLLRTSDIQGDPGLGAFVDEGTPGHGYFPLLPGSPAIDAGGAAATHQSSKSDKPRAAGSSTVSQGDCPATDQIGQPRIYHCDIGAIEWVADRVSIRQARFDSRSGVLFVSANSSAARDDVSLAVSVEGCLVETPMLRLDGSYLVLTEPKCGQLEGANVTVRSSRGGSATARIR